LAVEIPRQARVNHHDQELLDAGRSSGRNKRSGTDDEKIVFMDSVRLFRKRLGRNYALGISPDCGKALGQSLGS
jgi:hypothetical protein